MGRGRATMSLTRQRKIKIHESNDFCKCECQDQEVAGELHTKLLAAGFEIDDEHPDIVLSVGGDGTLLAAFHHYSHMVDQVRFVGVHTGHLGFYTDWRDYEIDQLINGYWKTTARV